MSSVNHDDIYQEVRAYLLGLFSCPPDTVIQGYQNNSPLPQNACVMTILFEHGLDVPVSRYDVDKDQAAVQQSVEVTMQLDFYGEAAANRARHIANFWKNHYTAGVLKKCQPLYNKDPQNQTFVNQSAQYEMKWSIDVTLQYNPYFEHDQIFLGMPTTTLSNP